MRFRKEKKIACWIFILCMCVAHNCNAQIDQKNDPHTRTIIDRAKIQTQQLLDYGNALLEQGETQKAMFYFQEASKAAPYDYRPVWEMIRIFMQDGRMDEAYKIMEQAGVYHQDNNSLYRLIDELDQTLTKAPSPEDLSIISIANFKDNKACALSFNFDDGAKQVYTHILPIFESYGFTATIPINPAVVAKSSKDPIWGSWEDWADAHRRGFEIANHTSTHADLTLLNEQDLEKEINQSYDVIEQKLNIKPTSFIFPFDRSDARSLQKVGERHLAVRHHNYLKHVYNNIFIPVYGGDFFSAQTANRIVNMAMRHNLWLTVEAHSIKTEIPTFKPLTVDFLKEHLKYLKDNEDKVWVDTFGRVYRYLALKKNAKLEIINSKPNSLTFHLSTSLDLTVYNVPLTVIIRPATDNWDNVSVFLENTGQKLPFQVDSQKQALYLDLLICNEAVTVRW